MAQLPSGIVTFLFTDIEGSTRMWEREPDLMWAAVARHNELLDDIIARHRGVHFKTIGDAFQAAFASPVDALIAVVDAQRLLETETWEGIGPLRVRMALHCGPAHPVEGDYLAPCLNRLSRMMSTGYGGQVLISDLVRRRVATSLPDGVSLRDLGRHRLRDLLEPERITQVLIAGLPDAFPPLKSLELHPTNLPIQPNPLVGREREIDAIMGMLRQDTIRLVTLTGVGGTGKTRLALQVGAEMLDEFQDGVFFVDLSTVPDSASVIPEIAATLGIPETTGMAFRDTLLSGLGEKSLLLILDNFEHVLEAGVDVTGILERCPDVRILATSRAPLRVRAEHARSIPPLEAPDPRHLPSLAALAEIDAVTLFVQRAAVADTGFALTEANASDVATICARLDGLPLAIELAAARIRTIPTSSLLQRLDHRLDVLTGGAQDLPERQRTLRATIEWSYDLLAPDASSLFRTVAVFTGGFSLEAVGALQATGGEPEIDPLDGITALVDRSLVRRVEAPDGGPRFTILETLREFGLEQLERSGNIDSVRDAHAEWCAALAGTADGKLTGPDQSVWLDRLEMEHDNLRSALGWTDTPERREQHLRIAAALARFWLIRGYLTEGRRWLDAIIGSFGGVPKSAGEIGAMSGSGNLAFAQGDMTLARKLYESSLQASRALGLRDQEATLLNNLGNIETTTGQLIEASKLYGQSLALAEELHDDLSRANALGNLGVIAHFQGDMDTAVARYSECMKLWRNLGNIRGESHMLVNLLLLLAPRPEHIERARIYGNRCLLLTRQLGDRLREALVLTGLGHVEEQRGDPDAARQYHQQAHDIYASLEDLNGLGRSSGNLGMLALDTGDVDRALLLLRDSLRLNIKTGDQDGIAYSLEGIAAAATEAGNDHVAARLLGLAERLRERVGASRPPESQSRYQGAVDALRSRLGEELVAAWAAGRELELESLTEQTIADLHAFDIHEETKPASVDMVLAELDTLAGLDNSRTRGEHRARSA